MHLLPVAAKGKRAAPSRPYRRRANWRALEKTGWPCSVCLIHPRPPIATATHAKKKLIPINGMGGIIVHPTMALLVAYVHLRQFNNAGVVTLLLVRMFIALKTSLLEQNPFEIHRMPS